MTANDPTYVTCECGTVIRREDREDHERDHEQLREADAIRRERWSAR